MKRQPERGGALLLAILTLFVLSALGAGLVLSSATDVRIAANERDTREAYRAADAALSQAMADLDDLPDWNAVLGGAVQSPFTDGPPSGTRRLRDGSTIDLAGLVSEATCGHASPCTAAEAEAITADRPWGANNPVWRPFAYGPSSGLADEAAGDRGWYLVVLVADDQSEQDGDPSRDADPGQPGNGVLALRAIACGPAGVRQVIDATVARVQGRSDHSSVGLPSTGIRLLSWRWTP